MKGIVCISTHTQRAVAGLANRTWVVPNAVEASFFEVNARPNPAVTPRILYLGRVCALKNQNAVIQALDPLAPRHKFELLFLGQATEGQPYGAEFLRLVKARPWCAYGDAANHEELRKHLREASLLVLASLEDNCPMVILEAMAAGLPVIAGRIGGIPDLIEDGRTVVLCRPDEPASIRAAVEASLTNPTVAAERAKLANQRARERFHPTVVAQRHVEIYQEIRSASRE